MKVSKRSWHYRLYRYIKNVPNGPRYLNPFAHVEREDYDVPKGGICPYAWSIFLGLLGTIVVGIVLIPFAIVATPFYLLYLGWLKVAHTIEESASRIHFTRKPKPFKPPRQRKPSLVAAYVRARKQKVCPQIELVD